MRVGIKTLLRFFVRVLTLAVAGLLAGMILIFSDLGPNVDGGLISFPAFILCFTSPSILAFVVFDMWWPGRWYKQVGFWIPAIASVWTLTFLMDVIDDFQDLGGYYNYGRNYQVLFIVMSVAIYLADLLVASGILTRKGNIRTLLRFLGRVLGLSALGFAVSAISLLLFIGFDNDGLFMFFPTLALIYLSPAILVFVGLDMWRPGRWYKHLGFWIPAGFLVVIFSIDASREPVKSYLGPLILMAVVTYLAGLLMARGISGRKGSTQTLLRLFGRGIAVSALGFVVAMFCFWSVLSHTDLDNETVLLTFPAFLLCSTLPATLTFLGLDMWRPGRWYKHLGFWGPISGLAAYLFLDQAFGFVDTEGYQSKAPAFLGLLVVMAIVTYLAALVVTRRRLGRSRPA